MLKNALRIVTLSAIVLAGLVVSASAQNPLLTRTTKVGFDFYVGDKLMPAGEYVIRAVSHETTHGVVMIEQMNGDAKIAVHTFPTKNRENLDAGSLLFKKQNGNHYLAAFKLENETAMHQILKNTESRIAKREATGKVAQAADAKPARASSEE